MNLVKEIRFIVNLKNELKKKIIRVSKGVKARGLVVRVLNS